MPCAKLIHVTISPSRLNMARRVHWFPASQATLHVCVLMNNVNFSVEAPGTNAAHRLSAAPTSGMGQSALGNCERRKGEPALSDKNNVSEYCSFHTHRKWNT